MNESKPVVFPTNGKCILWGCDRPAPSDKRGYCIPCYKSLRTELVQRVRKTKAHYVTNPKTGKRYKRPASKQLRWIRVKSKDMVPATRPVKPKGKCKTPGCDGIVRTLGLCAPCYRQDYKKRTWVVITREVKIPESWATRNGTTYRIPPHVSPRKVRVKITDLTPEERASLAKQSD